MLNRTSNFLPYFIILSLFFFLWCQCAKPKQPGVALPPQYRQMGSFIKTLPYYNPDSCVLLIKRDVPPQWQGAAYENLYFDGPENSPMELAYQHLDIYEKNFPADTARAFAQLYRGKLLDYDGHLDSARTCFQESYEISKRLGHRLRMIDAQSALAEIYYSEGKTPEALRGFLAVYEAVKDLDTAQTDRKITAINSLVAAYSQGNNHREAMRWARRITPMVEDESNPELLYRKVDNFRYMGVLYNRLDLPDSAILMTQKALDLQEKYQTINDRSNLMVDIGIAYLTKGDCQKALNQLLAAQNIRQDKYIEKEVARAYLCVGRLDSAEYYYERILNTTTGTTLSEVNTRLGEIYAKQGRYEKAYKAFKASIDYREEFFNVDKIQEIGAVKAELELERSQHQLDISEHLRKTAQLHKLIAFLSLLLALIIMGGLLFRHRGRRRILEQKNRLLAQEKQLAEARERLKSQALDLSQTELLQTTTVLASTKEELDSTARLLALKNNLIEELQMRLHNRNLAPLDAAENPIGNSELQGMKILTESDWKRFRERFEQSFPGYLLNLRNEFPKMTAAETRLFLLMKLNFDTQETADTLGISLESVQRSRRRLRSKLNLVSDLDMEDFVRTFE